jgi:hypothetical protein
LIIISQAFVMLLSFDCLAVAGKCHSVVRPKLSSANRCYKMERKFLPWLDFCYYSLCDDKLLNDRFCCHEKSTVQVSDTTGDAIGIIAGTKRILKKRKHF